MGISWGDVGKWATDTLYSVTPADNVMNIAREFQKPGGPDWKNIGKNVLGGAADVAMFALPAARAGKAAYWAGSSIPRVAASAVGRGAVTGAGIPLAFEGAGMLLGNRGQQGASPFTNFNRPASARPQWTDASGLVHTWNPRSGIYEVSGITEQPTQPIGGTTASAVPAAPTDLPAIDPRMQAQIDAARRQAVTAKERALADIATRGTQLALNSAAQQRGVGRQARGGFLDLMSNLSELGYSMSPAMAGVGQEAIAAREAANRAAVARELAGGRAQLGQETVAAEQNLREILNRLAAEELGARTGASFQGLQNYYGGR